MKGFGATILTMLKVTLLIFGVLLVVGGGLCGAIMSGDLLSHRAALANLPALLLILLLSAVPISIGAVLIRAMHRRLRRDR